MKGIELAPTEGSPPGGESIAWKGQVKTLWSTLAKSPMWENARTVQEIAQKLAEPLLESWQEKLMREANEAKVAREAGPTPQDKEDEEDAPAVDEVNELEQTPPTGRGVLTAQQVAATLQATVDDHVARYKASRTARKKKAAAHAADMLGDRAPAAEMPQTAEPPSLREIAARVVAPLLGGGGAAASSAPKGGFVPKAPQQQQQNFRRQQRQPLQPGLRQRTSYSQGPTPATTGPSPDLPPALRPEAGVTEERFRDVQRRYAENKAKQAGETAAARRSRERDEALARKVIMEMGECPNGFAWVRDGTMWECTGGAHRLSDEDIKAYVRKKQW
jgi:hypothetical protein